MDVLGTSSALIASAFLLHVMLWRTCKIKENMGVFVVFFSVYFAIGMYALSGVGWYGLAGFVGAGMPPARLFHVSLVCISFTCGYYLFYHMLIDDSPTVTIIGQISRAGRNGLGRDALSVIVTDENFVLHRLQYLVDVGHLAYDGESYRITPNGRRFLRSILFFKSLMRMSDNVG